MVKAFPVEFPELFFPTREIHPQFCLPAGRNFQPVESRRLGSMISGVNGLEFALAEPAMNRILHIRRIVRRAKAELEIGFVVGKKDLRRRGFEDPFVIFQRLMRTRHPSGSGSPKPRLQSASLVFASPRPRVAKPECREDIECSGLRSVIYNRDADGHIVRIVFRVFDEDVEVPTFIKDSRIGQLELRVFPSPTGVLLD